MKKVLFMSAIAAAALASCTSDEYVGQLTGSSGNGEISFGVGADRMTRAALNGAQAAEKLNNNFVVYGWKNGISGTGAGGNVVFDNYQLNWVDKANSTESNTHGWEYVGDGVEYVSVPLAGDGSQQSIKYWDYSATEYDFIAWTKAVDGATLKSMPTDGTGDFKAHYLVYDAPTAAALSKTYIADQVTVTDDHAAVGSTENKYGSYVQFRFRNMAAKVRLGIYETVPGYSIKDVKFYSYTKGTTSDAYPADKDVKSNLYSATNIPTSGEFTVKFYKQGVTDKNENEAVSSIVATEDTKDLELGNFVGSTVAEYKEAGSTYIGRTSNTCTFSAGDGVAENNYTYVIPSGAKELHLKVDYTLVSKDGNGEEIKITGAEAVVPANYADWQMNYAYTYLFKISDNTNGTSGTPGTNPVGLYPITFDALVLQTEVGNTQETITTVATPSITTYQKGSEVTVNDEYVASAGKIYIAYPNDYTDPKLYEAVDLGKDKEGITEASVANYINNDIVLSDITTSSLANVASPGIPSVVDGEYMTIGANFSAKEFTPEDNKIYVFECEKASIKYYKVIKMHNATPTVVCTLAAPSAGTVNEGEAVTIDLTDANSHKVYGARNYFTGADAFTVTEATPGTYTFTANAGTSGDKTIGLDGTSSTQVVTIYPYEFSATDVTVAELGTNIITLNLNSAAASINAADQTAAETAGFAIEGTGLSISSVAAGVVTIAADEGAKNGKITFTNNGVIVASADINVNLYSLVKKAGSEAIINGLGNVTTLVLNIGGSPVTAVTSGIVSSATTVATVGDASATGDVTVTSVAKGTTTISKGSAKFQIEVTDFNLAWYSDAECSASITEPTDAGTFYVKFLDGTTPKNASLVGTGVTLNATSTPGVYKATVAAGDDKITYTYKGVTFTLWTKTI